MINLKIVKEKISGNKFAKLGCLALFSIALGIGAGASYAINNKTVDNTVLSTSGYKYTKGELQIAKKTYEDALAKNKPLESALTPDQMVNLAYAKFEELDNAKTIGIGSSYSSGITQKIQTCTIKNNKEFFEESNSFSTIVQIYNRMYQQGDVTSTYWGADQNYAAHKKKDYSNDDYAKMMGRKVSDPLIYIVSPKTISNEENTISGLEKTGIYKNETGYRVEIEMATETKDQKTFMPGIEEYKKQMKTISNLVGYPKFYYCHLTFNLDFSLNLKSFTNIESYEANLGVMAPKCDGKMTTTYYTDKEYEIPKLTEKIEY